jgi:hypothetical protein
MLIPSHTVEQRVNLPFEVCHEVWDVIIKVKNWVATAIRKAEISWETKKETNELNEQLKKELIEKFKKLPDYEWSKVQEAIEKWTIEIKKIPWRDWYAIYESKVWNLVYIVKLDWTRYTNIDYFRDRPWYEDWLKWWYLRQWYSKIELKDWLWKLYNKEWKEIPIFSDKYSIATLNAINEMWDLANYIINYKIEKKKD